MATKTGAHQIVRVNRVLGEWFERRDLRLEDVWEPPAAELELRGRRLERLERWVVAFDRPHGAESGVSPWPEPAGPGSVGRRDDEWLRYDRWMRGEPLRWSYVREYGAPPPADALDEEAMRRELQVIATNLEKRGVILSLQDGVPLSLAYAYVTSVITWEEFEFTAPNVFTVLDGCDGDCPGCFQRAWCASGCDLSWPAAVSPEVRAAPVQSFVAAQVASGG